MRSSVKKEINNVLLSVECFLIKNNYATTFRTDRVDSIAFYIFCFLFFQYSKACEKRTQGQIKQRELDTYGKLLTNLFDVLTF